MSLFERSRGVVYPSDQYGEYIELEGEVTWVEADEDNEPYSAKVHTPEGTFDCFGTGQKPAVGYRARVRIYNAGGGWYPDDRIIGWSAPPSPPAQTGWAKLLSDDDPFG